MTTTSLLKEGVCSKNLVHASVNDACFGDSAATVALNGNDVRPGIMRSEFRDVSLKENGSQVDSFEFAGVLLSSVCRVSALCCPCCGLDLVGGIDNICGEFVEGTCGRSMEFVFGARA